jgi:hypothetical protein
LIGELFTVDFRKNLGAKITLYPYKYDVSGWGHVLTEN